MLGGFFLDLTTHLVRITQPQLAEQIADFKNMFEVGSEGVYEAVFGSSIL